MDAAGAEHAELWAPVVLKTLDEARQAVRSDFANGPDRVIQSAYLEQSLMGRLGKAIQPVFAPAGFDWKITVGVVSSFPAREVIISTLGIVYTLGPEVDEESGALRGSMKAATWPDGSPVFNPVVAVAIMVFFALCAQCGATVATIARESNWKWAAFNFAYMTGLAWLGAVTVYQVGSLLMGGGGGA
jgi:ferrous iron transport protein B